MAEDDKPGTDEPQPSKPYPGKPATHGYEPAKTPRPIRESDQRPSREGDGPPPPPRQGR
jgi:hypothetical protein